MTSRRRGWPKLTAAGRNEVYVKNINEDLSKYLLEAHHMKEDKFLEEAPSGHGFGQQWQVDLPQAPANWHCGS